MNDLLNAELHAGRIFIHTSHLRKLSAPSFAFFFVALSSFSPVPFVDIFFIVFPAV